MASDQPGAVHVANYIDNELTGLAKADGNDTRPTSAFQRVVERAVTHIQVRLRGD